MEEAAQSGIPVLFCHVPTKGRPYAINEMTDVLLRVAMLMVDIMQSAEGRTSGEWKPFIYPVSRD